MEHDRDDIVTVHPVPVGPPPSPKLPPFIAKTMNVCVNCVQAPGRMVAKAATRRYHKHYHSRHRFGRHHLVADVAMAVGILALLGVNAWFILGKPAFLPSHVRLAWDASATARVGDAVSFALTVVYEGNDPLDRATLALIPPDGFVVHRAAPGTYDAITHTLTLPAPIAPGASIGVTVEGIIEPPSDREIVVTATFHGSGASGSERQSAKTSLAVRGVAIVFELEAPPVVPANGIAGLALHYRSEAAIPLTNIVIHPALNNPFALVREDPWGGPRTIAPGENGTLTFEVRTKEAGRFLLESLVFQQQPDGTSVALGSFSSPLDMQEVPVEFGIASQGDGSPVARLGETIEIGASYQGQNGAALPKGFAKAFDVEIAGPLVSVSQLQATGAFEMQTNRVRWPFTPLPDGEIGGARFTITLPATVSTQYVDQTNFAYTFTPMLWLSWVGSDSRTSARIEGLPLTLAVAGELRLAASARYFTPEGDQIGRGPLPPRVGETTRYWVTWDLRAEIRGAGRTIVAATLPAGVEWTNRIATTAGDGVVYDTASRTVTWTVDEVPRTIGSARPAVSVGFELALTPTAAMAGTHALLLSATEATGADVFGASFQVSAPPVTTALLHDARARGMGVVRQ